MRRACASAITSDDQDHDDDDDDDDIYEFDEWLPTNAKKHDRGSVMERLPISKKQNN